MWTRPANLVAAGGQEAAVSAGAHPAVEAAVEVTSVEAEVVVEEVGVASREASLLFSCPVRSPCTRVPRPRFSWLE